jgi:predicted NAD/FAD-dependent oxidoreductase
MMSEDVSSARGLIQAKHEFNTNHQTYLDGQQHRSMQADKPNPVAHSLFTDLMRDIKRLHSHFTAIAYPVLNREGEMRTSRWRGYSEPKPETARDAVEGNAEDITAEAGNAVEGHVVEGNVEVKPS